MAERTNITGWWNYRVMHVEGHALSLIEVYYTGDGTDRGKISGWCEAGAPQGPTPAQLKEDISKMLRALQRPTLDKKDLPAHD